MQVQAHYDPAQDRIMLRLKDAAAADGTAVWLTRRQWTEIALACRRVAAALPPGDRADRPRKSVTGAGKEPAGGQRQGGGAAAAGTTVGGKGESRAAAATASLVSRIRFRRLPSGLRIEIATDAPAPIALTLKGESLASFNEMVEGLAAKANWDLPAALSRMSQPGVAPKRVLH
jgi:hypothetical protein